MFKLVVLSVVLAAAAASPSGIWGAGLAAPWGGAIAAPLAAPWGASIAAPLAAPLAAPIAAAPLGIAAPIGAYNYRGPLSLAPGQPANILANDGRPLDTLSVNLDRAAHITAKALSGGAHLLKKRSILGAPLAAAPIVAAAPWAAAPAVAWSSRVDIPAARVIAPAPIAVAAAPIAPLGLGLGAPVGHLLKKRSIVAAPLAAAPIVAPAPWAAARVIAPAPIAVAAAPIAPLGLGLGARVGHLW